MPYTRGFPARESTREQCKSKTHVVLEFVHTVVCSLICGSVSFVTADTGI